MNQHLQSILNFIQQSKHLSDEEKDTLLKAAKDADKELEIQNTLERVRAVAMRMKEPADMLEICKIISRQLELLNVKEIRNVQTAIFYESRRTYMNYEYYAKHNKTFITETTYTNNEIHNAFANQMLKGNGEFFITHIQGDEVKDWIAYQKTTNVFIDDYLNTASSLNYYWYSLGAVALGISTYEPLKEEDINLFKRFLKVFELSYTRYLDIEQAIAQARENQIQLALERVRARTMAMQKSDELSDTAYILFQQFKDLGEDPIQITIGIFNEQEKVIQLNVTGLDGSGSKIHQSFKMDIDEPSLLNKIYKEWKEQKKSSMLELAGKELHDWIAYRNLVARKYNMTGTTIGADERRFITAGFFSKGFISFSKSKSIPQQTIDILERFAGVFDSTYIRFLDLQKAESQARESQIELGLERVRARAMAMQTSEELNPLIGTVFTELTKLDLLLTRCVILIYEGNKKGVRWWMANSETPSTPMNFFVKYADMPFFNEYFKGWYNRLLKWQYCLEGENKIKTDDFLFTETELSLLPDFVIAGMRVPDRVYLNASFNNFGNLTLASLGPLSEEHFNILLRFAKVFDLTYTRFNDLQKAEAQAREAQIETALERVRSKTMAMYKHEDLLGVLGLLVEQLIKLGVQLEVANFSNGIPDADWDLWIEVVRHDGTTVNNYVHFPRIEHPYFHQVEKNIETFKSTGKDLFKNVFSKEDKDLWQQYVYAQTIYKDITTEKDWEYIYNKRGYTWSMIFLKDTWVSICRYNSTPFSDEEDALFRRFANAFGQAYTRFLDLQKAEAQAREAQIQLALERVRARTMAMQHSDELLDAATLLFQQIESLGAPTWNCSFNIWTADKKFATAWNGTKEGFNRPFNSPSSEDVFLDFYNASEQGEQLYIKEIGGKELEHHYQFMSTLPGVGTTLEELKNAGVVLPAFQVFYIAYFAQGYLMFITCEPVSQFADIFKRFAKVFEQTYTRFLDLQKAEAQTREAQIENALEKVRSRSLAVHKSDEFNEVIKVVFERLQELEIPMTSASINIVINRSKDTESYICGLGEDGLTLSHIRLIHFDHPIANDRYNAYKKGLEFFTNTYSEEEKNSFFEYEFEVSDLKHIPADIKKMVMESERYTISMALTKNSMIVVNDFEGKSLSSNQIDIVKRFSRVFEQAYIRFLDLQKAEVQAREAQIETALEKVRNRSLAMHKSDELKDVVTVVFERLKELNIVVEGGVAISIYTEGSRDQIQWVAAPDLISATRFSLPYTDDNIIADHLNAKESGIDFFAKTYSFEEKNSMLKYLFEHTDFKYLPDDIKNWVLQTESYSQSIAFSKNSSIFINSYSGKLLSGNDAEILKRFAKVFEQAYIRFLDLQKAEAQSRESQIQLALERARAQSMMMQHSKELDDTLRVFHEQVLQLNIPSAFSFLWLPDEEKDRHIFWAAWAENNSTVFKSKAINYPLDRNERATAQCLTDWKSNESVVSYHVPPDSVANYFTAWNELIAGVEQLKPEYFSDGLYYVEAFMKYGCFGVMVKNIFPEDEKKILSRFAVEFERAYTRFLDLQKAEAQAKESQIQLALERVRAKTLAMHSSEDVTSATETMFDELKKLGINNLRGGITNIHPEKTMDVFGITNMTDGKTMKGFTFFDMNEHSLWQRLFESWKNKEEVFIDYLEGGEKEDYINVVNSHQNYLPQSIVEFPDTHFQAYHFDQGAIWTYSLQPHSEIDREITKRFASVFSLTFRRYQDLQKAEAQARESQIQLALERVRARTMAMQKSDEFSEAVYVLFQQFKDLGEKPDQATIGVINEDEKVIEYWVTMYGNQINKGFKFSIDEPNVTNKIYKAWKESKKSLMIDLSGDALTEFMTYRAGKGGAAINPDEKRRIINVAFFSKGLLNVQSHEERSEESIKLLKRFASVFEQTYTRFLDLQKAEAQAREAKIEAALERVRSRSMGMQKSEELKEIIQVVYEQFVHLNIQVEHTGFIMDYKARDDMHIWLADKHAVPFQVTIPYFDCAHWNSFNEAKEKGKNFFVNHLSFEEKNKFYQDLFKLFPVPDEAKEYYFACPGLAVSTVLLDNVGLYIENFSGIPYSDEENNTLMRFGKVFQQTYTRFLDLEKAEAQAREAQIETSLERVRSKTMAMHNSTDVGETVAVMFDELVKLGIQTYRCGIGIMHDESKMEVWTAKSGADGKVDLIIGWLNMNLHPLFQGAYNGWKKKKEIFSYDLKDDDLINYFNAVNNYADYPVNYNIASLPKQIFHNDFYFAEGTLFAFSLEKLSEEKKKIFKRFSAVFGQTYRRYLDLQKAEAQAKEAQIEASLERVRSRAMAMQTSEELGALIGTVFTELTRLDLQLTRCVIWIFDVQTNGAIWWMANSEDPQNPINCEVPYNAYEPYLIFLEQWKKKTIKFQYELKGKIKKDWDKYLFNKTGLSRLPDFVIAGMKAPECVLLTASFNNFGAVNAASLEPLSDEHTDIMLRFAKVFDLTYTRFNDLKQAEASAREAKIEAALERVRGKAMAMHSSEDLTATIVTFYHELELFSITPRRCGVGLLNKENRIAEVSTMNSTVEGNSIELIGKMNLTVHPVLEGIYENWLLQKEYHPALRGNEIKEYYQLIRPQIAFPDYPDDEVLFGYFFFFSEGDVYAWTDKEMIEDELKIYRRFTSVLSLTYKRYKDLKDAEASAKEAVKQAALDRIRADIASMRTVNDLDRITPLIWNELAILGIPFIRCGVFIMNDEQQLIHTFLSTPDGKAIAAFHIPYDTPGNIKHVISHWHNNKNYIDHWDENAFTEFAEMLVTQGALISSKQYLKTIPHGGFYLHFLPFLQGMLYVGNTTQLGEEEINLIQSVADAFSTAYARYEDFNKLEAAKQQVDKTLVELKQTQQQLVQSEKMASLGELTAGIAHEIQNPLNFVNNFSEVNEELLIELIDEFDKGNAEEAKAIANDIKQNLEKINHHGKRADAIVKGMLQHSQKSTGQKEPTDINALCDEYLRLSYHGMRARDKFFNADFKTDFDNSIGKINIVPQDVGRVLLNLINNAFYAVNERKRIADENYKPLVSVQTKKINDKVEIKVGDNGNGIPQNIVDKIFQPFFTTKPTGQGTGLGLSLAYDIIKAHGGEIKVETKEDEFTEFIIVLLINQNG